MTFWQSPEWVAAVDSIYPEHGRHIKHPLSPLKEAWLLFKQRNQYDVIHTMGIRESMLYGLLCFLAASPSKQIMTEIFVDEDRPASISWRIKTAFYRLIAHRSSGIITNSRAEIPELARRLALPETRFRYVPLNSTVSPADEPIPGEGFLLAAGRSLRDYGTLIQAAPRIHAPIIIIGGSDDLQHTELPPNVTLHREVDRSTYLDHVRRCSIMILPLKKTTRPTGQVVLLEAMSFGKPVIATEHVGTCDYIRHSMNGLLVPPGDPDALANAVNELLADPEAARIMGSAALRRIRDEHTDFIHTQRRLDAIRDLTSLQEETEGKETTDYRP